jgi:hypothetical protein
LVPVIVIPDTVPAAVPVFVIVTVRVAEVFVV